MSYPPNYPCNPNYTTSGYPGYPQNSGYPYNQPSPTPGYPPAPSVSNQAPLPTPGYPPAPSASNQAPYPYPGNQPASYPSYPLNPAAVPAPYQPPQPSFTGFQPSVYPHLAPGGQPAHSSQQSYSQQPYPGYPPSAQPNYPGFCPNPNPTPGYSPAPPGLPTGSPSQFYPHHQQQQQHLSMDPDVPTVRPIAPFDARADADALHKAMKGLGTDEKGLITVLCHRNAYQRAQITAAFKSGYGKDLQSRLKSELSGNFERVMVALSLPLPDYLANELHEAVSGIGTDEADLIEILASRTNQEIRDIAAAYQRIYGHPLEKDLKGDTSGTFKMLLVSLVQGNRDENYIVDIHKAKEDAHRLYQAGEGKLGTDESAFNSILATRSLPQLRQIIVEYQLLRGHSLQKAVQSEFSGNAEKGYLAILQCAENKASFFAQRIHRAISGLGTKDRDLVRLIVSRCDIDLGNIKREYERLYGKSLQSDISGDTSGDYKKALLALIG